MIELADVLAADSAVLVQKGNSVFPAASANTREMAPGELFFALRGNRDGHDFVADAVTAGAGGVVVEREVPGLPDDLTVVRVPDTLKALQQVGTAVRNRSQATVVAVTGSAGKTTTKSTIGHVLASRHNVLSSRKSFNNHLGVPLNLAAIGPEHTHVVSEVGTNHRGEIDALVELVSPDIGVVTNVGFAHIGNFVDRDELADEKTDLLRRVRPGGTWVINGDDELIAAAIARNPIPEGVRIVRVGLGPDNDIRATDISFDETGTTGTVTADGASYPFAVPMAGRHFVYAVLAALAVGRACDIDLADGTDALRTLTPPPGRAALSRLKPNLLVIDDSYNASPDASLAALDLLGGLPADVRVAVLGEMRELGAHTADLHALVGRAAAAAATHLVVVGEATRDLTDAAAAAGLPTAHIHTASSARDAHQATATILATAGSAPAAVLAKGARFMHMERVPLGLTGTPVVCDLAVCSLYINCADCPKLTTG